MSRNRVNGAVRLGEEIEHPATRGMANCAKDIRLAIGSHHHAVNIRKETLTCQVRSNGPRLFSTAIPAMTYGKGSFPCAFARKERDLKSSLIRSGLLGMRTGSTIAAKLGKPRGGRTWSPGSADCS